MSNEDFVIARRPHVSGYVWIGKSVHTNPVNQAVIHIRNFLTPLSKVECLNTLLWIRNRIDAKSGYIYFLSGDVTRSSPLLYRKYCIWDGNLDACSVANIPRGVLGTRVNPDTCRIRVDGQIRFEYGYVRTWKFLILKEKVEDSKISGYVWTRGLSFL